MTSREGDGYSNEVAGFDGRYFMNDQSTLRFQYLDSRTEYPAAVATEFAQDEELEGDAWRVEYRYGSRNWFAQIWHQDLDPTFRADSGFISRVDIVQDRFEFNRTFYGDPRTRGTRTSASACRAADSETADGQLINRNIQPFIYVPRPAAVVRAARRRRRARSTGTAQTYDLQGGFMFGQFRPRSGLNINMQINRGEQIDYTNSRLGGSAPHPAADRLERDAPLARAPALHGGSLERQGRARRSSMPSSWTCG